MYIITMFANNDREEKLNKCFWTKDDPPLLLIVHIYNTFLKSTITKLPRSRAFMNFQDTFSKWNAHKDPGTQMKKQIMPKPSMSVALTSNLPCSPTTPTLTKKKRSVLGENFHARPGTCRHSSGISNRFCTGSSISCFIELIINEGKVLNWTQTPPESLILSSDGIFSMFGRTPKKIWGFLPRYQCRC